MTAKVYKAKSANLCDYCDYPCKHAKSKTHCAYYKSMVKAKKSFRKDSRSDYDS